MVKLCGCYKAPKLLEGNSDVQHTPAKRIPRRALSTNPSLLCDRVPYGPQALKFKREALENNPGLQLFQLSENDGPAFDLLRGGMNSLRAQVLDLNMMCDVMSFHRTLLTHSNIEVFYEWMEKTIAFFDRYVYMEDDIIFEMIKRYGVKLRGDMRHAARMLLRGRLQKSLYDLLDSQGDFRDNQPPGETFGIIPELVEKVTNSAVEYSTKFMDTMAPIMDESFSRNEIDRTHCRLIRYILDHENAKDNIVMYTRWTTKRELARWKRKYLFASSRIYVSFMFWERHMYEQHFKIAASFADVLHNEANNDSMDTKVEAEKWKLIYSRIARPVKSQEVVE